MIEKFFCVSYECGRDNNSGVSFIFVEITQKCTNIKVQLSHGDKKQSLWHSGVRSSCQQFSAQCSSLLINIGACVTKANLQYRHII